MGLLAFEGGQSVIAVEFGNKAEADFLGTDRFAGAGDGAGAEALLVHLADHGEGAPVLFGMALGQEVEVGDLGGNEQHGGGILAGGDAGAAADAGGSMVMVWPSLKWRMCNWQVAVPLCPPWGTPLMTREHMPQMPSRQSESKAMGSWPRSMSSSLTTSSISRKDMSSRTFFAS